MEPSRPKAGSLRNAATLRDVAGFARRLLRMNSGAACLEGSGPFETLAGSASQLLRDPDLRYLSAASS